VFLIWGWDNIKSSMCSRGILEYNTSSFYKSTQNHPALQIWTTSHATSPQGECSTSSCTIKASTHIKHHHQPMRYKAEK